MSAEALPRLYTYREAGYRLGVDAEEVARRVARGELRSTEVHAPAGVWWLVVELPSAGVAAERLPSGS